MKSFNWSKIPESKVIGKDNLWSRVAKSHNGSPNDLDFDVMEKLFCQQSVSPNGNTSPKFGESVDNDKRKKEVQEINLLDGKRSLNINIFLKQFRSSHENIVKILEDGAHEDLGAERLRGLLKILPEPDEAELLKNFDGDKTKLGNAEKFLLQLLEVPSYKLRIESMLLKEEFMANQEFLENSIETIGCAVQELEECKRLHEVMYMVLVAGNFMNAGGYAGNAAGFKMLSLLKLTDIRANKPSMTLIHYVAEQVMKKRPDLLQFVEEVQNLEEASKISMETLKTDVSSLWQRVSIVSTQVAAAEVEIKSKMNDFIEFAESKVETIQNEINNLDADRERLAEFLCEDANTFKLEDCFKVFHNFCSRFKAALQENERRHKQEKLAEARRKQREQQIALKRRSLELVSDSRSGVDADHIMDQLLGDIRSGFPERRLGDIFRRSRRSFDPDDSSAPAYGLDNNKTKSQNALKRHSDPAMLEKCAGSNYQEGIGTVKSRRARFLDETNGEEILGYLQNPNFADAERERRSFGSMEDNLERSSNRRSGRRKRVELLNGKTQSRERTGSSPPPPPPPLPLSTIDGQEAEINSKQKLRTKINEWMLQNEREQKRDRDLQLKLQQEKKKRQVIANGDVTNQERYILEEIQEIDPQASNKRKSSIFENSSGDGKETFELTKSAQSRQNESFTQKIIGLLNATSNATPAFTKTRLYHSTRESKCVKEELEPKSQDDIQISCQNEEIISSPSLSPSDNNPNPIASNSDEDSKDIDSKDASKVTGSNFDRFSSTRKTQRRIKLREMRIEAEKGVKIPKQDEVKTKTLVESDVALSPSEPTTDILVPEEFNLSQVKEDKSERKSEDKPDSPEKENINDSSADVPVINGFGDTTANKDTPTFSRPRNTSLRSRQSRLARRINSLTTPVASPEISENTNSINESELGTDETNGHILTPPTVKTHGNDADDSHKNSGKENEEEIVQNDQVKPPPVQRNTSTRSSTKQHDNTQAKGSEKKEGTKTQKMNGHISHKVTVSTETKSKVVLPKSNNPQLSKRTVIPPSKPRTQSQKTTSIPSVIKTTQNVKVQQTIQRQSSVTNSRLTSKSETNGVKSSQAPKSKSSPSATPSAPKKSNEPSKIQRNQTNGRTGSFRNGKDSPSSSLSSLCSLSTNVKLVKNEKLVNGKPSNTGNVKKITINHNGSVKFTKGVNINGTSNKITQKPLTNSNVNGISKIEKNTLSKKKAFV